MNGNYNTIQQLIAFWSEYEKKNPEGNFSDFGKWLSDHTATDKVTTDLGESDLSEETKDHRDFYKRMPESQQFMTLLSRSARFIDFYIKKAFEDLNINSRLEFQFLISIMEMGNPRKTDVIYFNLVEISTGVDTLSRLQKNKLVKELPDVNDKRIRRVALTTKGKALVAQALTQFVYLDQLTRTFATDESWKSMIPMLLKFNDFHNEIYHKYRSRSFKEIMDVIGVESGNQEIR